MNSFVIALFAASIFAFGMASQHIDLKVKPEPKIIRETSLGSCTTLVIRNNVAAKVKVRLHCGSNFEDPEVEVSPRVEQSIDVCGQKFADPPMCFILSWSKL